MTTALLDFLRNDDELAIVLGHEIAHTIYKHPAELEARGVPSEGLLRGFGKNASRVRATEEEADRLGIKDRKRAVEGQSVSVSVDLGGRRYFKQQREILELTY